MSDNPGTTPAAPPANKPPTRPDPAHPQGFAVVFGQKHDRMARFTSREAALQQARLQRHGKETIRIYEGRDWVGGKSPIREGAKPLLEVAEGADLPQ